MIAKNDRMGLRTWIEVDTRAIAHNYEIFRKLIPKSCKLMAVVKSNAYGHSLVDFSKEISKLGADWIGVDSVVEGFALRREGITLPILVLGYTLPELVHEAAEKNISLTVSDLSFFENLPKGKLSQKIHIHIEVDTGMHRQGFLSEHKETLFSALEKYKDFVKVEGLYTHFAEAKNPSSLEYTKGQISQFLEWKKSFESKGFSLVTHAGATAGTLLYPEADFDMVRIASGLFGLWPSHKLREAFEEKIHLTPILSWRTLISEVKEIEAGESVGYERTYKLSSRAKIAICPVGYWQGLPRSLSNNAEVLLNGKRAKIIGLVSMDMIILDCTDIPEVKVGDVVTLIGYDRDESIDVYELAEHADTGHNEIVTRINPLIKRIYF
ncbi:MAG: alanine racemase [Candidatus Pacebacteria bacterium]|nr:alanine racemase [Candidatus Paceibacterota bacterium]MDD5356720.1 alanine racemase [Candidatus Paceibacterota bacterium]